MICTIVWSIVGFAVLIILVVLYLDKRYYQIRREALGHPRQFQPKDGEVWRKVWQGENVCLMVQTYRHEHALKDSDPTLCTMCEVKFRDMEIDVKYQFDGEKMFPINQSKSIF